jgi:hypothetical protein
MTLISNEVRRAHRARWFVWTHDDSDRWERIPRPHGVRGYVAFDVECSCGWGSHTGGGTRGSVEHALWNHRLDEQFRLDAQT